MAKNIFTKAYNNIKHTANKNMDKDVTLRGASIAASMTEAGVKATESGVKAVKFVESAFSDKDLSRGEKEFEKSDEIKKKIQTEQDQRGGIRRTRTIETKQNNAENKTSVDRYMETEAEKARTAAQQKKINEEQQAAANKEKARLERLKNSKEAAMIHDMTEQVLGQTYKVPGTNISYDDAAIMAQNGIRDSDELTGISLEDDGFENSVSEVQEMMNGYVHNGVPDVEEFYTMTREYGADVIAQAYVNVVKDCNKQDLPKLASIDERFNFEHPAFERQFDYIRAHDAEADRVLDIVDMEMGRDRADEF